MTNRTLTVCALGGLVLPVTLASAQSKGKTGAQKKLNIVHIMSDDHSYQTISAYGGPVSKLAPTPNIDRLAASGMIFTKAYVENSISTPSRATLVTGKYSHQHGQIRLGGSTFDPNQPVFPAMLKANGYQTAVIGKWHLRGTPQGFDHYKVLQGQGNYYAPTFLSENSNGQYIREEGYASDLITDSAIEWMDKRDKQRPFCILVHHKSVHRPWVADTKYLTLYEDVDFPEPPPLFDDFRTRSDASPTAMQRIDKDMNFKSDLKLFEPGTSVDISEYKRMNKAQKAAWEKAYTASNAKFYKLNPKGDDMTRWKYQRYLKEYLRCVKSLDDQVGRILDYLDEKGLTDNTLIVYTSDQGFYMGEHGWFDKRFMYEESFRTPLLMSCPGLIKPGSVCSELVQNIDFAPTYLDFAGVTVPADMSGTPLRPLLASGKANGWRDLLYYRYYDYPSSHNTRAHEGVATKDYKIIHFKDNGGGKKGTDKPIDAWEFYDLKKDPTEVNNVYSDPAYAKAVAEMTKRFNDTKTSLRVEEHVKPFFEQEKQAKEAGAAGVQPSKKQGKKK